LTERTVRELEGIVGAGNVSLKDEELICYSRDSSLYEYKPDVVVRPSSSEQVAAILKIAERDVIPVTPRGAGTSSTGSPLPVKGGVVLDMTAMDKILRIDVENMMVEVEPGVVCDSLNEVLSEYGYFFPPDPASSPACTVGGMVANNAAGNRAMKYGTTREHVLWLEIVLPGGKIVHTGSRTLKSVSGFDLTRLLVGSEGSLGVVTKICLKLTPIPESFATAVFTFDDVETIAKAVSRIRAAKIVPDMLEFMSAKTAGAALEYAKIKEIPSGNFLLVDCDGSKESATRDMDSCLSILREFHPSYIQRTEDTSLRERLISARKAALPALSRLRPTTCMEDCTFPLSRLAQAATAIEDIPARLVSSSLDLANFGHLGDGNMHPTFMFDDRVESERREFQQGLDMLYRQIVLPLGGTITGEHGIGIVRAQYIEEEHGEEAVRLMRRIKELFDPKQILNPYKGKGGPWPIK
jgi:glycolate oxidase